MIDNYKKLDMWKKSMELCEKVYVVSRQFPNNELYGLTTQLRRACVSIASNIAEGFARRHLKEKKNFLSISQGSLVESETQIELAYRLRYINEVEKTELLGLTDHIGRMITNFVHTLR